MTASYIKPLTLPIWADTGLITVPSSAKQSQGWLNAEKPPASFFNWHQNLTGNWMRWISERLDDDPVVWQPLHAYSIGDRRANVGNSYIATTAGTSAASGGPTGTGTGIVDGTVVWNYQAAVNSNVFILKNPNTGTPQLRTIAADGIQIDRGLNVGFSGAVGFQEVRVGSTNFALIGGPTPNVQFFTTPAPVFIQGEQSPAKIFLVADSSQLVVTPGGVNIQSGLSVGSAGFTPVTDTIHLKDTNFGLDFTGANPFIRFEASNDFIFDRSANEFQFVVGSSVLGGVAGDSVKLTSINGFTGSNSNLKTFLVRTTAGATWTTVGTYIQNVTDVTYQNFIAFFGTAALAPLPGWVGITTAGVGIGAVSNSGPPAIASPTIFVDDTKLYVGNRNFSLEFSGGEGRINWTSSLTQRGNTGLSSVSYFSSSTERFRVIAGTLNSTLDLFGGASVLDSKINMDAVTSEITLFKSTGNPTLARIGSNFYRLEDPTLGSVWDVAFLTVSTGRMTFLADNLAFTKNTTTLESYNDIGLWNTNSDVSTPQGTGACVMVRCRNNTGGNLLQGTLLAIDANAGFPRVLNVRASPHDFFASIGPLQGLIASGVFGWVAVSGLAYFNIINATSITQNSYLSNQGGGGSGANGIVQHLTGGNAFMVGIPLTATSGNSDRHLIAREIQT